MRACLAIPALAVLAGCVGGPGPVDCRDPAWQSLTGQPLAALKAAVPDGGYKVDYPSPDGTVTLEDFPDRLRVTVNEDEMILGVACG